MVIYPIILSSLRLNKHGKTRSNVIDNSIFFCFSVEYYLFFIHFVFFSYSTSDFDRLRSQTGKFDRKKAIKHTYKLLGEPNS